MCIAQECDMCALLSGVACAGPQGRGTAPYRHAHLDARCPQVGQFEDRGHELVAADAVLSCRVIAPILLRLSHHHLLIPLLEHGPREQSRDLHVLITVEHLHRRAIGIRTHGSLRRGPPRLQLLDDRPVCAQRGAELDHVRSVERRVALRPKGDGVERFGRLHGEHRNR